MLRPRIHHHRFLQRCQRSRWWICHLLGWLLVRHLCFLLTLLLTLAYSGLQILNQIIVADITSLKWRGLVYGLVFAPFIVSAFVGPNIADGVLAGGGWRWGCTSIWHALFDFSLMGYFRWNVCYTMASCSCTSHCHALLG
jgi:hypothetical protein